MAKNKKKKILIVTGGGDCPGLNAVIRAVAKAARATGEWELWGSREAFNGFLLNDPPDVVRLTRKKTAGIHVKGGTILKTTNSGDPLAFPVVQPDGSIELVNRCPELAEKIRKEGFHAVINVGGDGSQRISMALHELGLNVVGVPKTIDNDLSGTDFTFGFATAVETATESFDKLVTTAESHDRVMIMEVMGRDAGWIALHAALAGGAEICLLPELPYELDKIVARIRKRYDKKRGFCNIVVAEGAKPKGGQVVAQKAVDVGDLHVKLGGVANFLRMQLEKHPDMPDVQVRTTILGHVQRGGTPIASDRILATAMGVKAFEMVEAGEFGRMVAFRNNDLETAPIEEVVKENKYVSPDHYLVRTARKTGIAFGN